MVNEIEVKKREPIRCSREALGLRSNLTARIVLSSMNPDHYLNDNEVILG
jgi:hypothetical protein